MLAAAVTFFSACETIKNLPTNTSGGLFSLANMAVGCFWGVSLPPSCLPPTNPMKISAAVARLARLPARPMLSLPPIRSTPGAAFPISRLNIKARSRKNSAKRLAIGFMVVMIAWPFAHGINLHLNRVK